MGITLTWLRLDARRRWRSLIVLSLLVAVATATVLTAVAGARRGQTAFDRLWARTLPATVTVLPNEPGFDWNKVRALPGVTALGLFAVYYGVAVEGLPGANIGFPPANAAPGQTVERPAVLQGRRYNPARADEVDVSPHFVAVYGKGVGDTLTLELSSPSQTDAGFSASAGGSPPRGPRIRVRIVGVVRDPFYLEAPGDSGGVLLSNALFTRYRADIMGNSAGTFVNALIRLRGGEAAIPAFRVDLARVTGRSDIDVWDNYATFGGPVNEVTGYEATWLVAFAIAALLAACILVGQSIARHVSGTAADLQVLRAVGMTRAEMVASAAAAPVLATAVGAPWAWRARSSRRAGCRLVSRPSPSPTPASTRTGWCSGPDGPPPCWSPRPGPPPPRGPPPRRAGRSRRRGAPRSRPARRRLLPVPVVMGTRFALEAGRGRTSVPVRPALAGVVVGVLGVVAAFTFYAGVRDAAANPARFGQTWQLETFLGDNGQDFGPVDAVLRAVAASPDVTGVIDTRVGGAQSGQVSVESFSYDSVDGKQVPVVLTAGRMPATATGVVLAPTTAKDLRAGIGSVVRLTGGAVPRA